MGPKEKGDTDHTTNNYIQLWAPKRENRNENRNTIQTEKTLLYFSCKGLLNVQRCHQTDLLKQTFWDHLRNK